MSSGLRLKQRAPHGTCPLNPGHVTLSFGDVHNVHKLFCYTSITVHQKEKKTQNNFVFDIWLSQPKKRKCNLSAI